jgi:hypothetical protein
MMGSNGGGQSAFFPYQRGQTNVLPGAVAPPGLKKDSVEFVPLTDENSPAPFQCPVLFGLRTGSYSPPGRRQVHIRLGAGSLGEAAIGGSRRQVAA